MRWKKMHTLIAVVVVVDLVTKAAPKKDSSGYRTTYACEGNNLSIACDSGVVHLIRANYGRFSISICNDNGNLDWRVNCMSHHSFLIMQQRCGLKPNCSVNVSSVTFHDPCPGTLKYLEVQYHCGTEMASSQSPLLKVVLPTNATGMHHPVVTSPTIPIIPLTKHATTSTTPFPENFTSEVTERPTDSSATLEASTAVYDRDSYCPPVFSRGTNWTWTKAGETAKSNCPDGALGVARWLCRNGTVEWTPDAPDLRECRSLWLENIKERIQNGESLISVASELAVMSLAKPVYSEDLKLIGDIIQQALFRSISSMENSLDTWHRYHVLRELLQSSVQTLSNLLDRKQQEAWNDLLLTERKIIISSLLQGLDESALLLAETSSDDGSFSLVKTNVLLSLQVLKSKTLKTLQFPVRAEILTEADGLHWFNIQDNILLPYGAVEDYSRNGFFKVIFMAFNKLNEFLKPSFYQPHDSNVTRIINSRVIGASLERNGNPKLLHPVIVTLKHIIERNVSNPVCVYWDFHLRDWSAQGCWVQTTNRSHTVCHCEHLTNFAVVMDLQSDLGIDTDAYLPHVVITIGCVVATICLILTVVILFMLSLELSEDSTFIHRNMFLCLLISELVFVSGIKQTKYFLACAIIAGMLQYLFLVTVSWLFFECYHQYITLIRPCHLKYAQPRWYYVSAYVLPGIVTMVSALVDPPSYGTRNYCWLQADNYFVFTFVGPAIGIIFGGVVFLFITLCMFATNFSINTTIKGKQSINLQNYRCWNKRSLLLVLLISLTWAAGLMFVNEESMLLAYSFSVLNSIQGVVILSLYCFRNEKVKQELKRMFLNEICFEPKKAHVPPNNCHPANSSNASREHISQEFWNFAKGKNCATSPIYAAQDRPSTTSRSSQLEIHNSRECVPNVNQDWKSNYYIGKMNEQKSVVNYSASQHSRYFGASSDSSGQFMEHIYETIDEDGNSNEQPAESYYSCHPPSGDHHEPSRSVQNERKVDFKPIPEQTDARHKDERALVVQQSSAHKWSPSLPDLLQCPADSRAVLAVLDGDKVVSRLQQNETLVHSQCKLNTYC